MLIKKQLALSAFNKWTIRLQIVTGACVLVFIANAINFAAIYSYFKVFRDDTGEPAYALW